MAEEKCITQKLVEGFGLDFPKDAEKFAEIFLKFSEDEPLGQLIDDLVEAFPDKKNSILSVPVHVTSDGKVHIEMLPNDG